MRFSIDFVTENEVHNSYQDLYRDDPTSANNIMQNVTILLHRISKYPGDAIATAHEGEEWEYPGTVELDDNYVFTIDNNPNITPEFLTGYFTNMDPMDVYTLNFNVRGGKRAHKKSKVRRSRRFRRAKRTRHSKYFFT